MIMGKKLSDYITDLSYLDFGGRVERAFLGGEAAMMFYGGLKVFNRAEYVLEVYDILVDTEGIEDVKGALLCNSYKTDFGGSPVDVPYEVSPSRIWPNEGEDTINGEINVRQSVSGFEIDIPYSQPGDRVVGYEYSNMYISSVTYMDIPAGGGSSYPTIFYSGVKTEVYASGKRKDRNFTEPATDIIDIQGSPLKNGVSFEDYTGKVTAGSLYDEEYDIENVAVVEYVRIRAVDGTELDTYTRYYARQRENVPSYGDWVYDIWSSVATRISGEAQTVTLSVSAWMYRDTVWSSGYEDTEWEETYAYIYVPYYCEASDTIVYGDDVVYIDIPQNGESSRKISVNVYNSTAGYDKYHTITQDAYVEPEYWEAPFINGSVNLEIPASGSRIAFSIPLKQYKRKGDSATPYEWTALASSVQGHAVESSGASFSGGYISCSSMGKNIYENGREAYYAERVWVVGQDGETYELDLDGDIIVRQAKNLRHATHYSYVLSISASPSSGIANTGGKSTVTASAQERFSVWYDSAPSSTSYENESTTASLSATQGTLSKTSIYGTSQTATLTFDENISKSTRTSTVKLAVGGTSKSCTVSQNAAVYVWGEPSLAETVPSSGATITFTIVSKLNGHACPISQVITSLSGATVAEQPTLIDSSRGEYRFKIKVPENTSTSDRTFTVTATQANSGDTNKWTVTQLKKSATTIKVARFMAMFAFDGSDYGTVNVTNARLVATGTDYSGGLVEDLSLRVVNKKTGAIYGNSGNLGDFNVPNNGTVYVSISKLSNSSYSKTDVGVEVWFGTEYQQSFDIMQLETDQ